MDLVITHLVLFGIALAAATIIPGSSEVALAASILVDPDHLITLFLTALAGNVLGSVLNWALGRWAIRLGEKNWSPITPAQLARASTLFNRYGYWLLLFSWVPVIGDPITFVSGSLRVSFWLFLVLVTLGKAARYAAVIGGIEIFQAMT